MGTYSNLMTFSGVVLAGGRSSRFGRDKAEHVFQDKHLMMWVLGSLEDAAERFIVANRAYPDYGVPVYADLIKTQSPLSGLHTALEHAKNDWIAVAACDLPHLTPSYWQALLPYCADHEAVVVRRGGRLEPLAALYHKRAGRLAKQKLLRGELALHTFVGSLDATIVPWETLALPHETLTNVNTQDDLV